MIRNFFYVLDTNNEHEDTNYEHKSMVQPFILLTDYLFCFGFSGHLLFVFIDYE